MRIVAGDLRGRSIEAPAGDGTRPTVDRVREALFSSLYSLRGGFEGAVVLDAFAGSGALGIEALSRGASRAVFYERDRAAAAVVKRNLIACGLDAQRAVVMQRDVLAAPPVATGLSFDLVLLDPPYAFAPSEVLGMVAGLVVSGALVKGGIVVYEHDLKRANEVAAAAQERDFSVYASRKYGKTGVTILRS